MGDEDEDQPEDDLTWQKYFLKPLSEVDKVVCMTKENGEAGHVSVRQIEDKFYFIAGSKNVHCLFRTHADLELYTDSRFRIAKTVGLAWLQQLEKLQASKIPFLLSFLHHSRLTLIFEILCPDYQHVVDLSYLDQPQLKFLTFTSQYQSNDQEKSDTDIQSLTTFSPDTCIEFARFFGLDSAEYEVVSVKETESKMDAIRAGTGYEGMVLYFMDTEGSTVGLLKKDNLVYNSKSHQGEGVTCLLNL